MMHQYLRRKMIGSMSGRLISGESFLLRRIYTAAQGRRLPENCERLDKGSLYKMLWAGGEIGMKMSDVLYLLEREGKHFHKPDLFACANTFRDCGHLRNSVEILEWMGKSTIDHAKGDPAVCLDIIYKLKGMYEVEKYLTSLPPAAKTLPTYGALLNYYSSILVRLQQKQRRRCMRR